MSLLGSAEVGGSVGWLAIALVLVGAESRADEMFPEELPVPGAARGLAECTELSLPVVVRGASVASPGAGGRAAGGKEPLPGPWGTSSSPVLPDPPHIPHPLLPPLLDRGLGLGERPM